MAKIPPSAFDYYVSLGTQRSYQRVAEQFNCAKRSVVKRAVKDRWQERAAMLEGKAREKADAAAVDAISEMSERHLKMAQFVQARALETIKAVPLNTAINAVRALDLSMRQERLIRGEPTEVSHTSIEERIKVEYKEWLRVDTNVALVTNGTSGS